MKALLLYQLLKLTKSKCYYFFRFFTRQLPTNQICLKYILDKNSQKQPLWVYCILTAAVHCTILSQLSSSSILQQNLLFQNCVIKGPSVGWKNNYPDLLLSSYFLCQQLKFLASDWFQLILTSNRKNGSKSCLNKLISCKVLRNLKIKQRLKISAVYLDKQKFYS